MRIIKEQSCGLIIDIQDKLYPHIHKFDVLIRNASILIRGLKILNIPVLLTQQYTKGLGETVPAIRELTSEVSPIEKNSFSWLHSSAIEKARQSFTLVISGSTSFTSRMERSKRKRHPPRGAIWSLLRFTAVMFSGVSLSSNRKYP